MKPENYPCFVTALGVTVEVPSKERLEFWIDAFLEAGASVFTFEREEERWQKNSVKQMISEEL